MRILACLLFFQIPILFAFAENDEQEAGENRAPGAFFFALGENILSNTLLYLADRYIAKESWAQVTPNSIWENLSGPWEWDRHEYFTNQFGHPYQGSIYHTKARSNGFDFYHAMLFDAFIDLRNKIEGYLLSHIRILEAYTIMHNDLTLFR